MGKVPMVIYYPDSNAVVQHALKAALLTRLAHAHTQKKRPVLGPKIQAICLKGPQRARQKNTIPHFPLGSLACRNKAFSSFSRSGDFPKKKAAQFTG